jgi:RHS repeat-associated protein
VTNTYDQYAAPGLTNYTPALTMHGNTNYGTSFLYRGNVTTSLMPGQTRNFNYDVGGNVVSADDGHGHTAALTLDTTTNYTQPVLMTPNSNSNLASSYTYNGDIQVTSTTGPNGSTATIGYDSLGRPSTTTSPDGAVTTYAYTLNTTTATANGHFTRSTVDGLGRTVRVETGDATGTKSQTDSVYGPCGCSPLGKLIQQSQPYVPNGTPVWTTYTYDALGRTVQISAPGGSGTTTYSYQGNTTTVTDPTGKWKTYTKNAVGQMVHVSEPAPEGGTHETTYTANVLNQLTQVSMPRTGGTQTRTFNYSLTTGLLMSKSEPESGTVTYTYNTDSSLATMTDAKGQQVAYTYDTLGRTIQIARHNAPGYPDDPCQQDTITYDLGPGGTNVHGQGRMTIYQSGASGCTNGMVKETLSYTPSGHVASKGMQLNGLYGASGSVNYSGTLTANFTYNANGTLNQITYPNTYTLNGPSCASTPGPTFTYAYDTLERPAGVTDASQASWVKNISYGPANELLQMKRLIGDVYNSQTGATVPDFYTEVRTYNASLQLTRLTATADTVPGWTTYPTMDRGYIFSATQDNGQIVQQEDYVASEEVNYTYDSLRRLSLAQTTGTQWGQSFSYDGFGNLTGKQVTKGSAPSMSLSYNEATNRIATAGYQYDANGNLTAMPNETMTYDVANRLVQANSTLNGTEFYGYGAGDRRIWKNTGGMPEFTFWGPDGQKLGTYGPPSGNWCIGEKKINLYFAGQLIWNGPSNPNAQQLMGGVPGGAMVLDRMGTAVVQNGQTVSYFPYGEPRAGSGSNFETYQRDATTGFDYAQNRYYANVAGRFLTADPFAGSARGGAPQSWNRYTYVLGDPINSNDSDGLDSTQKCGATDQYINGIDQGTLSHIMSTNSNEEILAQTIYTESGHSSSADVFEEEWAITAVLMNRWQFVNHNWYLYSAPVVNGLQPILSLAGWGVQGDSIASVAENPSQFAVYRNAGGTVSLTPSAQSNLNSTLASDATSSQCFDLSVAITLGYAAWGNRNQDQLFKYKGIVLIDFNSFMSSHPSESYAIFAGSFGDANKFYGVPGSYVSTTRPPLRAHPIRPKRGQ